jgi:hypothetical protein
MLQNILSGILIKFHLYFTYPFSIVPHQSVKNRIFCERRSILVLFLKHCVVFYQKKKKIKAQTGITKTADISFNNKLRIVTSLL